MDRIENLHILTRRLIILTAVSLMVFGAIFSSSLYLNNRLMMTWVVFTCGIIGGFVSIQQRIKKISDEELELICGSWYQILLIPIFGATFSLVLYCIFLSGILNSNIFPEFYFPSPPPNGPNTAFIVSILHDTYPKSGPDLAKLIFWSFAAGFAERLVPQIISTITRQQLDEAERQDTDTPRD